MNLLEETLESLTWNKRTPDDVEWVGDWHGEHGVTWQQFAAMARCINYDNGYGNVEIPSDLVVVGNDWWLGRYEFNGAECWNYHQLPHCATMNADSPVLPCLVHLLPSSKI